MIRIIPDLAFRLLSLGLAFEYLPMYGDVLSGLFGQVGYRLDRLGFNA